MLIKVFTSLTEKMKRTKRPGVMMAVKTICGIMITRMKILFSKNQFLVILIF